MGALPLIYIPLGSPVGLLAVTVHLQCVCVCFDAALGFVWCVHVAILRVTCFTLTMPI